MLKSTTTLLFLLAACSPSSPEPPPVDDPTTLEEVRDSGAFLHKAVSPYSESSFNLSTSASAPSPGMGMGASGWDREEWCGGPFTATFLASPAPFAVKALERAKECGMKIMIVIPRRFQTVNESSPGRFSPSASARAAGDYAAYLTQFKSYVTTGHLVGFIVLDDMGCEPCWGGTAITPAEAETAYKAWKTKLPGVPMGIRVVPNWIKQRPSLAQYIDFAWAQYVLVRGDYKKYYETARKDAATLGIKLAGGINIYHFSEPGSGRPIDADELSVIGNYFLDQPYFCFGVSWMAWDGWQSQGRGVVWDQLVLKAKNKTNVPSCAK